MSEAAPADDIVRKGEFAAICNVTPGRVSQWIKEGKIHGGALVGRGRDQRVRVSLAQAQLRQVLDISQRFGNGLTTRLDPPARPAEPAARPAVDSSIEGRIKAEKLRQAELLTRRQLEEERARRGMYVLASDARAETARAAGTVLRFLEGGLNGLAQDLAAQFGVPQRETLHALRKGFRGIRAGAVKALQRELEGVEPLVEDEVEHDRDSAGERPPVVDRGDDPGPDPAGRGGLSPLGPGEHRLQ